MPSPRTRTSRSASTEPPWPREQWTSSASSTDRARSMPMDACPSPTQKRQTPAYRTTVYPSDKDRRRRTGGIQVRVVEYRLEGVAEAEPLYRLVTTILDPAQAPAAELAALYHERWEIEGALAELKTQLRGARVVLRSKTPELVRQEVWGLLLAHFAVRGLMHEAALRADEDPDRLSFSHAVRVVRRKLPLFAALPPSRQARPA